jgi:hypothetical protein
MRKLTLASLLALSISVLHASEANAFSTKALFNGLDSAESGANTDLTPLLYSTLNVQGNAPAASQSVEPALVVEPAAISVQPQAVGVLSLSEGFESVSGLSSKGWFFQNNSSPIPLSPSTWTQAVTSTSNFAAQSSPADSYAQVDFSSTAGDITQANGTISNWLITPELDFSQGGVFSFFARTFGGNSRAELIEARLSGAGSSINVGTLATDVGDFTTLVGAAGSLTIPATSPGSGISTSSWTKYSFNIAPQAGSGRLAFRYFATDGGVNGTQAQYAALDTVSYLAVPEPAISSLTGFAVLGLASYFKGKRKCKVT